MEVDGWDGIDNISAQMNGWETRNFLDIEVNHRRMTGSYFGLSRDVSKLDNLHIP